MLEGRLWIILGGVLCTALVAADAWPQAPLPGTLQPGQIERQFEKFPEPRAKPAEIRIPDTGQKPPANADAVRFVLNRLTVEGVTVYSTETLRSAYEAFLGKEVTLAEIYRIANVLSTRYRNDGFILSQVIVPAQAVEDGAVRLQAVEGYIANVRVEGEDAALQERVGRYAEKIRAARPLTAQALERYLLLVNDLPGVSARATLSPATTESGASDLALRLSRRVVTGGLSADNRGSRAQGPRRFLGDVDAHSVFGGQSRTGFKFVMTGDEELRYLSLTHDQLIGTEGGKFGIAVNLVKSTPEERSIIPLNLVTDSKTVTLAYSHPVIRSREQNLYLRGALSTFNSKTEIFGVQDTDDRVRPLRLGLTYDRSDALGGVNIVDAEFSHGLRALGASSNGDPFLSRPNGKVDFSKVTLYAARLQSLPANWSMLAGVNAQHALTDLLASELFGVGGEQFGRGYDPSEILGDHGIALKLELRYGGTLPAQTPTSYTAYGFYDVGKVRQRTPVPGVDAVQSAASAGLGVRLSLGRQLSGFVELAQPLTRIVGQENDRNTRTYVGISIRF